MEAMDQHTVTIERFLAYAFLDSLEKLVDKVDNSSWWLCVFVISLPFYVLAVVVYIILAPILGGVRLAVTHADRVVFVIASAFLSFYQVPRKVFYTYMAVLAFTGFFQFLRYNSSVRERFLYYVSCISCGTSNMFLRKFTTLHFSNPFNRCLTRSKVVYVPIGLELPSKFNSCEVFDFPISVSLNFDTTIGICRINVETLGDIGTSTIRFFCVDAPWGWNSFTVNMENDNLGRLISYFNRV